MHGHKFALVETDGGGVPESARWPLATVNVPVGTTQCVEFIAENLGDWPLHCHKNHHTMNAMNHDIPNLLGVDQNKTTTRVSDLVPGYMEMGSSGMHDMTGMQMPLPKNTLPMMAGDGPYGAIAMGGMFTLVKVRENLTSYADPGWYQQPPGTSARRVS
jgi:hypothetical protein